MKDDIEKVFVNRTDLNDDDRIKIVTDKYPEREFTDKESHAILEIIRPKQLKKLVNYLATNEILRHITILRHVVVLGE